MAVKLTSANFESELKKHKVALVDFWAEWCPPCRAIAPIIEELAEEFKGRALIAKINTDEEKTISNNFDIMSIPTLIIFVDGKEADRIIGTRPKEEFIKELNKYL